MSVTAADQVPGAVAVRMLARVALPLHDGALVVPAVHLHAPAPGEGVAGAVVVVGQVAAEQLVARTPGTVSVAATAAGAHHHLVTITLEHGLPASGQPSEVLVKCC